MPSLRRPGAPLLPIDALPRIEVESRAAWRDWLQVHHADSGPVWLVTFKKHCSDRHVPWPELVQEALCFGWIDGRTRRVDDDRVMVLMGPRKRGGTWSRINKGHVARLLAQGQMTPAGLAAVEAAKADGSWTFLDDIDAGIEPTDLGQALDALPEARRHWDGFSLSSRKVILYWIKTAKTPGTRAARIAHTVELAARGQRAAHPGPVG